MADGGFAEHELGRALYCIMGMMSGAVYRVMGIVGQREPEIQSQDGIRVRAITHMDLNTYPTHRQSRAHPTASRRARAALSACRHYIMKPD